MTEEPTTMPSLESLVAAAGWARAAFDWEAALAASGRALASVGAGGMEGGWKIPPETAYALHDTQAEAHRHLGDLAAEEADLAAMARLAGESGDPERRLRVLLRRSDLAFRRGRMAEARRQAQAVLDEARQRGDRAIEAAGLLAVGMTYVQESRFDEGRGYAEQAAALSHVLGDAVAEAWALLWLSFADSRQERSADANLRCQAALELFRRGGDREGEARALNGLGIQCADLAKKRSFYEQALSAFVAVGDRHRQAMVFNNLAMADARLGLYALARDHASEAVETARRMEARGDLAYYLDTLARVCLAQGDMAAAEKLFQEGLDLSREIGDPGLEAAYAFGLARAAHGSSRLDKACELYRAAEELFGRVGIPGEQATCLAWLGAARLELGDVEAAGVHTAQAVSLLESVGSASTEYPPQEIWWWRYQALATLPPAAAGETEGADSAWQALDCARSAMLAGIANLSDDGLRRNYLNKVLVNRQVVSEWLCQASRRGAALVPLTSALAGPSGGQEQFRRMLDIGLRLNARRQTGDLARFVVDQVVELTGAERVALYRLDEAGRRQAAAQFSVESAPSTAEISAFLDEVLLKRQALLRYTPPDAPEIKQHSILCVPLVSAGKLVGLIYADVAGIYGRFTDRDRDLLIILANQTAVALENAAWAESLEQRVEERTAELQAANRRLEERTAELQVINSVQQGLASQLDMQAIIELVGDKIRDIFDAQVVMISSYDVATGLSSLSYGIEKGQRLYLEPYPLSRFAKHLIATRQPVLINEDATRRRAELGMPPVVPGTEAPLSLLFVPLIAGNEVTGAISLQNLDREHAFGESDVRLLTTLAGSMSVALENARLFDKANRLLAETQRRTSELEIINHVGVALARQLDSEAIVALVGERLREVFPGQMCSIALYDRASDVIRWPYFVGLDGEEIRPEPVPLGAGLTSYVIRTRQPHMHGTLEEGRAYGSVWVYDEAEREPQSWIGVPLLIGDEAIGVLAVQDLPQNRYTENDVRLLATLAASMGVALENARLFAEANRLLEETRQRATELSTVNRISQALATQLDLDALIRLVGEQIRSAFHADIAYVALVDRQAAMIHFPYMFGQDISPLKLGEGLTSRIILSGQPLLINQSLDSRRVELGIQRIGLDARSYLGVPIMVGQEAIGALSVQSTTEEGRFDEDDLRLLNTIAANVGAALQNARLYQETQRRAVEMATLAGVSREISATLDLSVVLERIAGQARELLAAETGAVYLLQPDGHTLKAIAATGGAAEAVLADEARLGDGIIGHIVQSGVAERIDDTTRDPRGVHILGTEETPEGEKLMVAPLLVQERAIGALAVWRNPEDPPFHEAELSFSIGLAQQAAVAIENARLFAEVQSQKQFSESLVQNIPVAIVTAAADDTVTSWNPGAERLFGYSQAEALGRELVGLITTPEMRAEAVRFADHAIGGGRVHTVTRRRRKDGSLVDVELLAVPVSSGDNEPGFVAIYHDITELRQATRTIEESQRRMADIIDFLPDATLVIDHEGRVIAWNRAIEQMTGVKAADMLGKGNYEYSVPFYEERRPILIDLVLLPDEEIETRYAYLQRSGASLIGEALVPHLRGEPAYLYATASALRNARGEVVGAIETIRDISDRKRAEEELRQAKAAAESATQAKSAFLATMSHEIRTPMNAVIGMTSLLLDTPLAPEQRDFAETIRTSGDALLTIINDILDFSKIEAGRLDLESTPLDLRECVEGALDLLAPRAREKNLNLAYLIEPNVPVAIVGDVTRLRQILVNLLGNAVKFTEQGEVVLSVCASTSAVGVAPQGPTAEAEGGYELRFSVRDTGIGIPPDRMDRLFQSFSQVDGSTTRRYGGTGLGLAISHRLAEMMGGRMWAESAGVPGWGSTFHFTIKALPASLPTRAELKAEAPDLRGKHVLIVDDNATNRRILTLQTQGWGMLPRDTGSPGEVLDWLRQGEVFDVALIDRQMPEMDGPALASQIKALRPQIPLIMVSSLSQREAGVEAASFSAFLLKPIKPSQLFNALASIFAKASEVAKAAETTRQFDAEMGKHHPLRILVAEDNAVNQKLALRLLERLGYRADVAANGVEAIRAVERQPYDVVLMDVQMPEMDGLEATRAICARWTASERPRIVAVTANALAEDREACLAAGMDDYLSKPIRVEELMAALRRSRSVQ